MRCRAQPKELDSLSTNEIERMTAFEGTESEFKWKKGMRKMQLGSTYRMDTLFAVVPNGGSENGKRLKKVGGAGSPRCAILLSSCRNSTTAVAQHWFRSTSIATNAIRSYPLEIKSRKSIEITHKSLSIEETTLRFVPHSIRKIPAFGFSMRLNEFRDLCIYLFDYN